jgi:hypothetical protein
MKTADGNDKLGKGCIVVSRPIATISETAAMPKLLKISIKMPVLPVLLMS